MEYAQELFSNFYEDAQHLFEEHWASISMDRDVAAVNPDYATYQIMEDQGIMALTTARVDGEPVGYAIYLLATSMHRKELEIADLDVTWLTFDHRKGLAGIRLLRAAEENLKAHGIKRVLGTSQLHADIGKVYEYMGYHAIERVYSKDL